MSTFQPQQQPQRMGNDWTPPRPMVVEKPKGSPPCLLYGAIGCAVVIVLLIIAGAVAYFAGMKWLAGKVEEYTDTQPVTLPTVEMSATDVQALTARVSAFKTAVDKNEAAPPLVLTEQDLNALIENSPDWKDLKGKVYVSMKDNLLEGQVSFPLDALEFPPARGRYLNGSAAFDVTLRNGALFVTLKAAQVRGKALPQEVVAGLQAKNLAEQAQRENPDLNQLLAKLDSIEVKDGTLVITPKKVSAEGIAVEAPEKAGASAPANAEAEPSTTGESPAAAPAAAPPEPAEQNKQ